MKKLLLLLFFIAPSLHAGQQNKYVQIGTGALQAGTTAGFNVSSGTVQYLNYNTITSTGGVMLGSASIQGTITNNNAAVGFVGESQRSFVARTSGVSATTTGQWFNISTITLTAGDWLVSGIAKLNANGATITANTMAMAISISSGNTTTDHVDGDNTVDFNGTTPGASADGTVVCPNYRLSLNATTPVYLKLLAGYSVAVPKGSGRISGVRIR